MIVNLTTVGKSRGNLIQGYLLSYFGGEGQDIRKVKLTEVKFQGKGGYEMRITEL